MVCLDCGKQFTYDWKQMRVLKPVEATNTGGVLQPEVVRPRKKKVRYALWASAVPLAWFLHKSVTGSKKDTGVPTPDPDRDAKNSGLTNTR